MSPADSATENCYDGSVLEKLDFSKYVGKFNPPISPKEPGPGLLLRPLNINDYHKGFMPLLAQLTTVGNVTFEQFTQRFLEMKQCPDTYFVTVVEDINSGKIVASATLVLEQKFIHHCAKRGRIEDLVVCDSKRGKQLGKLMIATLTAMAEFFKVYKVTLECKNELVTFYGQFDYKIEIKGSNYLQLRFN